MTPLRVVIRSPLTLSGPRWPTKEQNSTKYTTYFKIFVTWHERIKTFVPLIKIYIKGHFRIYYTLGPQRWLDPGA